MKNFDSSALISRMKLIEYPSYSATRSVTNSCLLLIRSGNFASSVISQIKVLKNLDLVLFIVMPPFEEGGAYCVAHVGRSVCRSVGMSGALNLVQLINPERFAPEASNLVGR